MHGLRFPVDRNGALADHAGDTAQHGTRDARFACGAVRARAGERDLDGETGSRRGRTWRDVPVHEHAGTGATGGGGVPLPTAWTPWVGACAGTLLLARGKLPRYGG